jgi:hypothetical protein
MTPSGAPTPPRAWRCRPSTAICCGVTVAGPGSCHEQELLEVSGVRAVLDATGVTALVDRGFRGMAKARARWHAPIGDRRTNDQRTPAERDHSRLQAGLRVLVEQAIGHLANAWTLRRWRGLRTGSGTSTGPPRRSSASADGSIASRHEQSIRTPSLTTWSTML